MSQFELLLSSNGYGKEPARLAETEYAYEPQPEFSHATPPPSPRPESNAADSRGDVSGWASQ